MCKTAEWVIYQGAAVYSWATLATEEEEGGMKEGEREKKKRDELDR